MSETARARAEPAPAAWQDADAPPYSKDYWDLVFEQLSRRRLFKLGVVVLAVLYGAAIHAPLIASDKPYVLEAVDIEGYSAALRLLSPMTSSAARLVETTDEAYAATAAKNPKAPRDRGAAFAVEWRAALDRLAILRAALPEGGGPGGPRPALDELERELEAGAAAFGVTPRYVRQLGEAGLFDARIAVDAGALPRWGGPADVEAARASLDSAKARARNLRNELAPLDPAKPEAGGLALVGRRSYPLLESLRPFEVGLMALWALAVTWPIWNRVVDRRLLGGRRERIRAARRKKAAAVVGLALLAAFAWRVGVGRGAAAFDPSPYKAGITSGSIRPVEPGRAIAAARDAGEAGGARDARAGGDSRAAGEDAVGGGGRVVWAPIPYGYAETSLSEILRPPTWRDEAAIDPATGAMLHPKWAPERDVVTGRLAASRPLVVQAGEPPANAWNRHVLGTDGGGRDFLGRLIWGSRVSLSVGIASASILTLIGVLVGALAGYFGGRVDIVVMRAIEILQSIPAFFLILLAMAFTDPETVPPMVAIVLVIGLVGWTGVARLVRGEFLRLRDQEFVIAARALGYSDARTIFRHVLPNAMSPVLVAGAFAVAAGILMESAISYLGFGVSPPDASWGSLVRESQSEKHWWIQVFPGLLIFLTVTCYNLVGDAVRDALDPKMNV